MDVLRAPWRMNYISSPIKEEGCIFCRYAAEAKDAENLIVFRGQSCFAILNRYPYSSGHLMIVPYRHTSNILTLSAAERDELMASAQDAVAALEAAYSPEGYNLGINIGKAAGAGIDAHLHLHVVPRWNGDTNFMSATAETKVLPEALSVTRERILEEWPHRK
jgi:Diadenosine tetraphosphate (Ap4A) hydrolase and other HIT family hydrolases